MADDHEHKPVETVELDQHLTVDENGNPTKDGTGLVAFFRGDRVHPGVLARFKHSHNRAKQHSDNAKPSSGA